MLLNYKIYNMFFRIWKYRSKLIKSFFLDFLIFIFLSILYSEVFFNRIDLLILNFSLWIILSYTIGRYHDFKKINNQIIIRNIFKTFIIFLLLINLCFVLEKVFYFQKDFTFSFNDLTYFYFINSTLSIIINLVFNFIYLKNKRNMKWIILKENYLLKCLEKDNIESKTFLQKKFKITYGNK